MQSRVESGTLAVVTHEKRGKEIDRRRIAHGIRSVREFSERTGLSRETVTKALAGEASEGTYQRLEAWLDAFDEEVGEDMPVRVFEFELEGEAGRFIGRLPAADPEEIERIVAAIARGLKASQDDASPG